MEVAREQGSGDSASADEERGRSARLGDGVQFSKNRKTQSSPPACETAASLYVSTLYQTSGSLSTTMFGESRQWAVRGILRGAHLRFTFHNSGGFDRACVGFKLHFLVIARMVWVKTRRVCLHCEGVCAGPGPSPRLCWGFCGSRAEWLRTLVQPPAEPGAIESARGAGCFLIQMFT